jgi:hypothetical protein
MKSFWTPERRAQLDRYLKAGKSTMEIALAMGLKRKQITNKCVRSGLVSMCVDCGVKPKYRQYRRCMSCKEAREAMCVDCGVKPKYRQYRRCMSCKEAREVRLCASSHGKTAPRVTRQAPELRTALRGTLH